jgi:enoyl-CoA hydratase
VFDTHEALVAHALATAREIAEKSPLAVAGSKVMINYARDHSIADALDYIATWQTGMFSGSAHGRGVHRQGPEARRGYPDLLPLKKRM